jgi:type IV pilus assembly protein PilO
MASLGLEKLNSSGKVAVGAVFAVLVALAYYVVFFGELEAKIARARNQEKQHQSELADARQSEHLYQKDLAELTERQQRQNQLAKVLPNTTEYPAFLSAVQTVANVSGVVLSGWAPSPEQVEQFYARVPMKLTLEGRFHQIAKFFYGIGQLDRIINMENIAMQDPKVVESDVVVKVTALATAFRTLNPDETKTTKRPPANGASPTGGAR